MALQTLAMPWIVAFFVLALALGVLMTLPIGGADMPVVISLYNAFTGLAVAFEGYVLGNEALIIAGMMVGAAGMLLTRLMAKAMNRPISGVLFSNFGGSSAAMQEIGGSMKPIEAGDVAAMMAYAERVVIVPGYGMAVAQAQHKIWELSQRLIERGVKVKFAIHPVAGRMPGHMNVLLAEAGVPYDLIADMDDINPEFANTDVSLVIGANDVVNPVAKTDPASPIYGMPILDVTNSKNTVVIKRGKGTGFAGIENALFYQDNTRMLYGDGAKWRARWSANSRRSTAGIDPAQFNAAAARVGRTTRTARRPAGASRCCRRSRPGPSALARRPTAAPRRRSSPRTTRGHRSHQPPAANVRAAAPSAAPAGNRRRPSRT